MIMPIPIRQGRYAPGKLISPKAASIFWKLEHKDGDGNLTASLECPEAVEIRFLRPLGAGGFNISVFSRLDEHGEGDEWVMIIPSDRMGILFVPQGFTAEQSLMGTVYRLPEPRHVRILADQMVQMPGLNFTVQFQG